MPVTFILINAKVMNHPLVIIYHILHIQKIYSAYDRLITMVCLPVVMLRVVGVVGWTAIVGAARSIDED